MHTDEMPARCMYSSSDCLDVLKSQISEDDVDPN